MLGLMGYGGLAAMLAMILVEPPTGRELSGVRAVMLMPSFLALIVLGTMGPLEGCDLAAGECVPTIVISEVRTAGVLEVEGGGIDVAAVQGAAGVEAASCVAVAGVGNCTAAVFTATEREAIYLQNQGWGLWHYSFAALVLIMLIIQIVVLMTTPSKKPAPGGGGPPGK